ARGCSESSPVSHDRIDTLFLEGGDVHAFQTFLGRDGQGPQVPGFNLVSYFVVAGHATGGSTCQHRGQCLAASGVGDVVGIFRVDADFLGHFAGEQVVNGTQRTAGD